MVRRQAAWRGSSQHAGWLAHASPTPDASLSLTPHLHPTIHVARISSDYQQQQTTSSRGSALHREPCDKRLTATSPRHLCSPAQISTQLLSRLAPVLLLQGKPAFRVTHIQSERESKDSSPPSSAWTMGCRLAASEKSRGGRPGSTRLACGQCRGQEVVACCMPRC